MTEVWILGQWNAADALECVQQLLDCRLAQLRVGGVRHASIRKKLQPQRALGRLAQPIAGRLTIHQEASSRGMLVGVLGAGAVALFADQEQQPGAMPVAAKLLRGGDLRRDDPLGIARATPVNAAAVLP